VSVYVRLRLLVPADLKLVTEEVDVPAWIRCQGGSAKCFAGGWSRMSLAIYFGANCMSTKN
jgi:hypothetical protein